MQIASAFVYVVEPWWWASIGSEGWGAAGGPTLVVVWVKPWWWHGSNPGGGHR